MSTTSTARQQFRFRPNTLDEWVYHQVVASNEYRLPRQFKPEDIILDIGGHIGSFSYACWLRGSRSITLFEPAPENCEAILYNLFGLPGITLDTAAVWRSDVDVAFLIHTGFPATPNGVNTGGGNVIWDNGVHLQVPAVKFDDIVDTHTHNGEDLIRLLKIDAETSEFPILLTSKKLGYVCEIVGEYHEVGGDFNDATIPAPARIIDPVTSEPYPAYTMALLAEFLRDHGFQVTSNRLGNTNMGHFHAKKPALLLQLAQNVRKTA